MYSIHNMLRLIRINLLWLLKYHCKFPPNVWFAGEYIEKGSPVYIANKRLHLLRVCKASEIGTAYGLFLDDGESVLTKGHFDMTHNFNPAHYDVMISSELDWDDGINTKENEHLPDKPTPHAIALLCEINDKIACIAAVTNISIPILEKGIMRIGLQSSLDYAEAVYEVACAGDDIASMLSDY